MAAQAGNIQLAAVPHAYSGVLGWHDDQGRGLESSFDAEARQPWHEK